MNARIGTVRPIGPTPDPLDIALAHPAIATRGLSREDLAEILAAVRGAWQTDVSIAGIVRWVAAESGLAGRNILSREGDAALCRARALIYWGARRVLRRSYPQIGRALGRHSSTAIDGVRRAEHLRNVDPAFRALSEQLLATFAKEPSA